MSVTHCENCDRYVDCDDDPDCFVYVGNFKRYHGEMVMCESCRDEMEIDMEQQDAERAKGESIAEQVEQKMREAKLCAR